MVLLIHLSPVTELFRHAQTLIVTGEVVYSHRSLRFHLTALNKDGHLIMNDEATEISVKRATLTVFHKSGSGGPLQHTIVANR